jgi:NAD(P)-dependent dehydrogenase (short-subunit alcohol dehydrogenase family)
VTGGAGYLGSAITRALHEEAAQVLCLDLPGKAAALIEKEGLSRCLPIDLDVSEVDRAAEHIARLVETHGLPDGFVHLPTASSRGRLLPELPVDEFRRTFDVALTPTFVWCRELAERMRVRGSGSVVLFASMYGLVAPDPTIYQAPMRPNPVDYGAAKAALIQLTRYLASYYGPAGLRFNCVTPGPFPNPQVQADDPRFITELGKKTALRRIGSNREIVGPTLFLLGDSSSYVTGHSLVVDGGWTVY